MQDFSDGFDCLHVFIVSDVSNTVQGIRVTDRPVRHSKVYSNIQVDLASPENIVEKAGALLQFKLLEDQLLFAGIYLFRT